MKELTLLNPFVVGKYVSPHYFCDREIETQWLIKQITNGRNTALVSFRRMGKTGLITHLFNQPEIKGHYHTVFVDVYACTSMTEFVYSLGKAILEQVRKDKHNFIEQFFRAIKSLKVGFTVDPVTGETSFDLGLGSIQSPEITLDEIFKYLESMDKPCVVAIDEFQQVGSYQEQQAEALLRSKIQQCKKTVFIFSGSKRHLMYNMFNSPAKPFYQSAVSMGLDAITLDKYTPFVQSLFEERGKSVSPSVVKKVYQQFDGTTWYMQLMMNELFTSTGYGECCNDEQVEIALNNIIRVQDGGYRMLLSQLSYKQKQVLQAIAKEGKAYSITSADFVEKHRLNSASSVQSAVRTLMKKDILTQQDDCYWIYDYFFGEWMKHNF